MFKSDKTPVWLMRQAGRYLPEYRALKEKYSFLELCRSPELAAEVTLQPLRRFEVDIAIIFADILLPLQGMGIELDFNPGPKIFNPVSKPEDVKSLSADGGESNKYVPEAIRLVKKEHDTIFGFCGSPWTLACYITDPGKYKHFQNTVIFARTQQAAFEDLMEMLVEVLSEYLNLQLEAGVKAVQIFDSWGGILSAEDYKRYSLPWIEKLLSKVNGNTILYCGNGQHLLEEVFESSADYISLDWRCNLEAACALAQKKNKGIQGNLDPTILFESPDIVSKATKSMLSKVAPDVPYIANLGHGVLQDTPIESVRTFVDTVHG